MGDGVNIAARLEGIAEPGAICLSEQAYWQVKARLDLQVSDLGHTQLKNIAEPVRVYSLQVGLPAQAKPATPVSALSLSGPPRSGFLKDRRVEALGEPAVVGELLNRQRIVAVPLPYARAAMESFW